MTPEEIKKEGLMHYDRMIAWAKTQPEKERPCPRDMLNSIGEKWSAQYCIYCHNYRRCYYCTLNGCCDIFWVKMDNSYTWKDWIFWAGKIREFIKVNG